MTSSRTLPVICVNEGAEAPDLNAAQRQWVTANGFSGQSGRLLALPDEEGALAGYLFGMGGPDRQPLVTGQAAASLEPGRYRLAGAFGDPDLAALGFRLGAYRFDRYRPKAGSGRIDDDYAWGGSIILPAVTDGCRADAT